MAAYLVLNLSPRPKGTSAMLSRQCAEYLVNQGKTARAMGLYKHLTDLSPLLEAARDADALVFIGPCYLNTYPADTYRLLAAMCESGIEYTGKRVYAMIQGGMPYAHTHENGLSAVRLFAGQCGAQYMGGFVMGLGPLVDGESLDKLPHAKKVKRALDGFFAQIANLQPAPNAQYMKAQFPTPPLLGYVLTKFMNRGRRKDFEAHGIDYNQPNPYLSMDE